MLINPPAPPKPSMTSDSAVASMIGFCHGSALTHPNAPRPPRSRLAISADAQIVNADRHRHHDEQDKGNPPHRVAVKPAADRAREDRVIGDVGRDQPEIDD